VTVRPLRFLGDPILRTPCDPVVRFDDALARLIDDLLESVQEPGRAGLAAFSYYVDGQLGYLINPEIVALSGTQSGPEACLSIPGVSAERDRAAQATAAGVDLRGDPVRVTGTGELARCLQHETDHLHGELYIDKLAGAERRRVLREVYQH
jgi:peptide deformylase